jgi:hypothetical protein
MAPTKGSSLALSCRSSSQTRSSGDIPEHWRRRPGSASARTGFVVVWILKKRRMQVPGVSLQPGDEPLLLMQRLPLAHKDLVLLALRARPGQSRCVPAKQPTDQTSHSGIA